MRDGARNVSDRRAQSAIARTKTGVTLSRLVIGTFPRTMERQVKNARKYRTKLETLVCESKGIIGLTDAHLINEATMHEMHCCIMRWCLRTKLDKMSVQDIAKCSAEIVKATTARNKCVDKLKLDEALKQSDTFAALYSRVEDGE